MVHQAQKGRVETSSLLCACFSLTWHVNIFLSLEIKKGRTLRIWWLSPQSRQGCVMKPVRHDEAFCRHGFHAPSISFSFLNQRRSAAGLLPWVMQVRVMWSPSRAGFVSPLICGFSGTPEVWNRNTDTPAESDILLQKDVTVAELHQRVPARADDVSGRCPVAFQDQLTQMKNISSCRWILTDLPPPGWGMKVKNTALCVWLSQKSCS